MAAANEINMIGPSTEQDRRSVFEQSWRPVDRRSLGQDPAKPVCAQQAVELAKREALRLAKADWVRTCRVI